MTGPRLGSTYRLQLQGLGFRGATALVPYLDDLGIETLYLSPVLAAVPGSTHGYDVVDPLRLDASLVRDEDLEELLALLLARGMRALLDIVPNHMATDRANAWWWSVLRGGRRSPSADIFDIDWSRHGGRVLVPTLDRPLAEILDDHAVTLDEQRRELDVGAATFPAADDTPAGPAASILAAQHYRPAYWRIGPSEGNYRRFFDIGSLIGVRVEDPGVFDRTHPRIGTLARHPGVAGIRVDHIDGLADPAQYLGRLRAFLEEVTVVVEKILGPDETLDPAWPVDGTTGYEFADHVLALFVDPPGSAHLLALGAELTGSDDPAFATEAQRAKREVLDQSFGADLDRLTRLTRDALDQLVPGHDLARRDLRQAWVELTVHLDAYRTYLSEEDVASADRDRIARAAARSRHGDETPGDRHEVDRALALLQQGLLAHAPGASPWLEVSRRWQQLSGAVMAKAVEDTATYRYVGLSARADVGSDPDVHRTPDSFHRFVAQRTHGLNATSTHDSKRNEDARCRLAVLSEAHGAWATLVRRWHDRYAQGGQRLAVPRPLEELRAYETLFTLWPSAPDAGPDGLDTAEGTIGGRAKTYAIKAAREAKVHTSWTAPDMSYEEQLASFIDRLHTDPEFRSEMTRFSGSISQSALCNTLALVILKTCCPGVPDFYQGTERLESVLTDPDNRRPVDFAARAADLAGLPDVSEAAAARLLSIGTGGPLKLYVTRILLRERRASPNVFDRGSYDALPVTSDHALALARTLHDQCLVAIVPRLTHGMVDAPRPPIGRGVWGETTVCLPERWNGRRFRDLLTGREVATRTGRLSLAELLDILPVAVLRAG